MCIDGLAGPAAFPVAGLMCMFGVGWTGVCCDIITVPVAPAATMLVAVRGVCGVRIRG